MGPELKNHLPRLIDSVTKAQRKVTWVCDPMHGNGVTRNGKKTRLIEDIIDEINTFFQIHREKGTIPGGIHLEMTANDVTECLGGKYVETSSDFLSKKYETLCDPRLNLVQTVEVIEETIKFYDLK